MAVSLLNTLRNFTLTFPVSIFKEGRGTQIRIKDTRKLRYKVLNLSQRRKKGIKNLVCQSSSFSSCNQNKGAQRRFQHQRSPRSQVKLGKSLGYRNTSRLGCVLRD